MLQPQSSRVIVLHVYIIAQEYYVSAAIVTFMLKCIVGIKCMLVLYPVITSALFTKSECVCVQWRVALYNLILVVLTLSIIPDEPSQCAD